MALWITFATKKACSRGASLVYLAIQKTNNTDVVEQQFVILWLI
jgi:hypothetical protein